MLPFAGQTETKIHIADSRELYRYVSPNSVDMVVTSPPYGIFATETDCG